MACQEVSMRAVTPAQLARLVGDWRGRGPDYLALAGTVGGLVLDGLLAPGVRVPSERDLARALGVSRTTVTAAFDVLREQGMLVSRRGAGSWTAAPPGRQVRTHGMWDPATGADTLDLALAALPATQALADAVDRAVCELPRYAATPGYEALGVAPLREAVAAAYERRGLPTSPDQILVTNGVQHALHLALCLLVAPGDAVVVESPTYPAALDAVRRSRARLVPSGLTPHGWDAELLEATLRQAAPRLAYLIADFHNPTGHLMDAATRERVAAAAHQVGVDVLVDETFAELALGDRALGGLAPEPPPPLAAFDRGGRVLSAGGMSKAYWGGLRVGWVRAAPPLVQRLAALRASVDMASPLLDQLVAAALLDASDEVVAQRRAELRQRRDVLVAALRRDLPEWRFAVPAGGVSLWAELERPVSGALCRAAEAHGVRLAPGTRFGPDGVLDRFVRLPFTLPPDRLDLAVRRLAAARRDLDRPGSPGRLPPVLA
jgi:DNA-binding transcriptional MocR family regulator